MNLGRNGASLILAGFYGVWGVGGKARTRRLTFRLANRQMGSVLAPMAQLDSASASEGKTGVFSLAYKMPFLSAKQA